MHGRNMASRLAVRSLLRSPNLPFGRSASLLRSAMLSFLVEAGCSQRPFAPPHRPVRFRTCRGEITAPGLLLRCRTDLRFQPVRPELRSSPPFPAFGELPRPEPVVGRSVRRLPAYLRRSLPFRTCVLPDQSAPPISAFEAYPRIRPDLPSLPAGCEWFIKLNRRITVPGPLPFAGLAVP